jgi:ADP-heptose:LPS heptosyltransferase
MFELIRAKYPRSSIHLLLFGRNQGLLEVLDLVPRANLLILDDRSFLGFVLSGIRILRSFHRLRIDTVFDCELFSRISSLISLLSGAKVRVGFHPHTQEGLYRGDFINRPVIYNPYVHISAQFMTMVHSLEQQGTPSTKIVDPPGPLPEPKTLRLDPAERMAFHKRFYTDFPELGRGKLVLLYPGGGLLPIRAWPLVHYCEVAKDLTRMGYVVGVIGMAEDRPMAEKICSEHSGRSCLNLAGYTKSIKELVLLMEGASLLITNDGGPGHFACLTSTPSIVLYGPETPALYGTLGGNARFLYQGLPCSPCLTAYNHRKSPCDGNNVCMKSISPWRVVEIAYELLGKSCPSGNRSVENES